MNALQEIKWRWEHCRAPLPGELKAVRLPVGMARVIGVWSEGKDAESNMVKRRIRGLLGYGEGWTLKGTILDIAMPLYIVILLYKEYKNAKTKKIDC